MVPGLLWGVGGINKDNPATDYLTRHWADGPANFTPTFTTTTLILVIIFKIMFNDNILTNDDNTVSLLYQCSGYEGVTEGGY